MNKGLKEKIIQLHNEGYSYRKIQKKLNCSKGTINYYLTDITKRNLELKTKEKSKLLEFIESNLPESREEFNELYSDKLTYEERRYFYKKYFKYSPMATTKNGMPSYYKVRRRLLKEQMVDYKGGKCVKCGYNKSMRALEFHHINPEDKDFELGGKLRPFDESLQNELDKCILVCANCHAEIHDDDINF